MNEDLESEVAALIRGRLQDGDVPHSALEYASERVEGNPAFSLRVAAQLRKGLPIKLENVIDETIGDELLMRRMEGMLEQFCTLVAKKMVEDELERRVASGEVERRVDESGVVSYSRV